MSDYSGGQNALISRLIFAFSPRVPLAPVCAKNAGKSEARSRAAENGPGDDPRAILYLLASVMLADGCATSKEKAFIARVAQEQGLAALRPSELRVHHPMVVHPHVAKDRRREALGVMAELASIDGCVDASQLRLILAYAGVWGVSTVEVQRWLARFSWKYASWLRRLRWRLKDVIFPTEVEADECRS